MICQACSLGHHDLCDQLCSCDCPINDTAEFLVVDRIRLKVRKFKSAHEVAIYMLGKDNRGYLIIKDEKKAFQLPCTEFSQIELYLEQA